MFKKILKITGIVVGSVLAFAGSVFGVMALMGRFNTPNVYPDALVFSNNNEIVIADYNKTYSFELNGVTSKNYTINHTECELWFTDLNGAKLIELCSDDGTPLQANAQNRYEVNCNSKIYYRLKSLNDANKDLNGKVQLMARSINDSISVDSEVFTLWIDKEVDTLYLDDNSNYNEDIQQAQKVTIPTATGELEVDYVVNPDNAREPILGRESAKDVEIYFDDKNDTEEDYIKVTPNTVENGNLQNIMRYDEATGKFYFVSEFEGLYDFKVAMFKTYQDRDEYNLAPKQTNFEKLQAKNAAGEPMMVVLNLTVEFVNANVDTVEMGGSVVFDLFAHNNYITLDGMAQSSVVGYNNLDLSMTIDGKETDVRYNSTANVKFEDMEIENITPIFKSQQGEVFDLNSVVTPDASTIYIDDNNYIVKQISYGGINYYCSNGAAVYNATDKTWGLISAGTYINFYISDENETKFTLNTEDDFKFEASRVAEEDNKGMYASWNIIAKNEVANLKLGVLVVNSNGLIDFDNVFAYTDVAINTVDMEYEIKKPTVELEINYNDKGDIQLPSISYEDVFEVTGGSYYAPILLSETDMGVKTLEKTITINNNNYFIVGSMKDVDNNDKDDFINSIELTEDIKKNGLSLSLFKIKHDYPYDEEGNKYSATQLAKMLIEEYVANGTLSGEIVGKNVVSVTAKHNYNNNIVNAEYAYVPVEGADANFAEEEIIEVYEQTSRHKIKLTAPTGMLKNIALFEEIGNWVDHLSFNIGTGVYLEITGVSALNSTETEDELIITIDALSKLSTEDFVELQLFGQTVAKIKVLDATPSKVGFKYNNVDFLLSQDSNSALNSQDYIDVEVGYNAGDYTYKYYYKSTNEISFVFNGEIAPSEEVVNNGFYDADKINKNGVSYSAEYSSTDNNVFMIAKEIAGSLTTSKLDIYRQGTALLQVKINNKNFFLKVNVVNDGNFKLQQIGYYNANNQYEINQDYSGPINLLSFMEYKHNDTVIEQPIAIANVELNKYEDEFDGYYLAPNNDETVYTLYVYTMAKGENGEDVKNSTDLLEISKDGNNWIITRTNNIHTPIQFTLTLETVAIKEVKVTFTLTSNIQISFNKLDWNRSKTLYQNTSILVYEVVAQPTDKFNENALIKIVADETSSKIVVAYAIGNAKLTDDNICQRQDNNTISNPLKLKSLTDDLKFYIYNNSSESLEGAQLLGVIEGFKVVPNAIVTEMENAFVSETENELSNKIVVKSFSVGNTYGLDASYYNAGELNPSENVTSNIDYVLKGKKEGQEIPGIDGAKIGQIKEIGYSKTVTLTVRYNVGYDNYIVIKEKDVLLKNKYTYYDFNLKGSNVTYTQAEITKSNFEANKIKLFVYDAGNSKYIKLEESATFNSETNYYYANLYFKTLTNVESFIDGRTITEITDDNDDISFSGSQFTATDKHSGVQLKITLDNGLIYDTYVVFKENVTIEPYTPVRKDEFAISEQEFDLLSVWTLPDSNIKSITATEISEDLEIDANKVEFPSITGASKDYVVTYVVTYQDNSEYKFTETVTVKNIQQIIRTYPQQDNVLIVPEGINFRFVNENDANNLNAKAVNKEQKIYHISNMPYEPVLVTNKTVIINFNQDDAKFSRIAIYELVNNEYNKIPTVSIVASQIDGVTASVNQNGWSVTINTATSTVEGYLLLKFETKSGNFEYYCLYLSSAKGSGIDTTKINASNIAYINAKIEEDSTLIFADLLGYKFKDNTKQFTTDGTGETLASSFGVNPQFVRMYIYGASELGGKQYAFDDIERFSYVNNTKIPASTSKYTTVTIGLIYYNNPNKFDIGRIVLTIQPTTAETTTTPDGVMDLVLANADAINGEYVANINANASSINTPFTGATIVSINGAEQAGNTGTLSLTSRVDKETIIEVVYKIGEVGSELFVKVTYTQMPISVPNNETFSNIGEFQGEGVGFKTSYVVYNNSDAEAVEKNLFGTYQGQVTINGKTFGLSTTGEIDLGSGITYLNGALTFTLTDKEQTLTLNVSFDQYIIDGEAVTRTYTFRVVAGIASYTDGNIATNSSTNRLGTSATGSYGSAVGSSLNITKGTQSNYKTYTISAGSDASQVICISNDTEPNITASFVLKNYVLVGGAINNDSITIGDNTQIDFVHLAASQDNTLQIKVGTKTFNYYISIAKTYGGIQAVYTTAGAGYETVKSEQIISELYNHFTSELSTQNDIAGKNVENSTRIKLLDSNGKVVNYEDIGFTMENNRNKLSFTAEGSNNAITSYTFAKTNIAYGDATIRISNLAGVDLEYEFKIAPSTTSTELFDYNTDLITGTYDSDKTYISMVNGFGNETKIMSLKDETSNFFVVATDGINEGSLNDLEEETAKLYKEYKVGPVDDYSLTIRYYLKDKVKDSVVTFLKGDITATVTKTGGVEVGDQTEFVVSLFGNSNIIIENLKIVSTNLTLVSEYADTPIERHAFVTTINLMENTDNVYDETEVSYLYYTVDVDEDNNGEIDKVENKALHNLGGITLVDATDGQVWTYIYDDYTREGVADPTIYQFDGRELRLNGIGYKRINAVFKFDVILGTTKIATITMKINIMRNVEFVVNNDCDSGLATNFQMTNPQGDSAITYKKDQEQNFPITYNIQPITTETEGRELYDELKFDLRIVSTKELYGISDVTFEVDQEHAEVYQYSDKVYVSGKTITFNENYSGQIRLIAYAYGKTYKAYWTINVSPLADVYLPKNQTTLGVVYNTTAGEKVNIIATSSIKNTEGVIVSIPEKAASVYYDKINLKITDATISAKYIYINQNTTFDPKTVYNATTDNKFIIIGENNPKTLSGTDLVHSITLPQLPKSNNPYESTYVIYHLKFTLNGQDYEFYVAYEIMDKLTVGTNNSDIVVETELFGADNNILGLFAYKETFKFKVEDVKYIATLKLNSAKDVVMVIAKDTASEPSVTSASESTSYDGTYTYNVTQEVFVGSYDSSTITNPLTNDSVVKLKIDKEAGTINKVTFINPNSITSKSLGTLADNDGVFTYTHSDGYTYALSAEKDKITKSKSGESDVDYEKSGDYYADMDGNLLEIGTGNVLYEVTIDNSPDIGEMTADTDGIYKYTDSDGYTYALSAEKDKITKSKSGESDVDYEKSGDYYTNGSEYLAINGTKLKKVIDIGCELFTSSELSQISDKKSYYVGSEYLQNVVYTVSPADIYDYQWFINSISDIKLDNKTFTLTYFEDKDVWGIDLSANGHLFNNDHKVDLKVIAEGVENYVIPAKDSTNNGFILRSENTISTVATKVYTIDDIFGSFNTNDTIKNYPIVGIVSEIEIQDDWKNWFKSGNRNAGDKVSVSDYTDYGITIFDNYNLYKFTVTYSAGAVVTSSVGGSWYSVSQDYYVIQTDIGGIYIPNYSNIYYNTDAYVVGYIQGEEYQSINFYKDFRFKVYTMSSDGIVCKNLSSANYDSSDAKLKNNGFSDGIVKIKTSDLSDYKIENPTAQYYESTIDITISGTTLNEKIRFLLPTEPEYFINDSSTEIEVTDQITELTGSGLDYYVTFDKDNHKIAVISEKVNKYFEDNKTATELKLQFTAKVGEKTYTLNLVIKKPKSQTE